MALALLDLVGWASEEGQAELTTEGVQRRALTVWKQNVVTVRRDKALVLIDLDTCAWKTPRTEEPGYICMTIFHGRGATPTMLGDNRLPAPGESRDVTIFRLPPFEPPVIENNLTVGHRQSPPRDQYPVPPPGDRWSTVLTRPRHAKRGYAPPPTAYTREAGSCGMGL